VIDRRCERLIAIGQVPEQCQLRSDGTAPNRETVARWARQGCRGLRLESVMIGGRCYTSVEAVERFIQNLSGDRQK
jgi:hypothetical protein